MRALLTLLLLCGAARAEPCGDAARVAEAAFGVPDGLLAAIGRVESGRAAGGGRTAAWPWSVNAAGRGYFLNSAAEAATLVASIQAGGIRSVDVGCFQVNLLHHPDAFAGLSDAFDPGRNATEAARFLSALRTRTGGWEAAVAAYHSMTPALGEPYRRAVYASLTGGPAMPSPPPSRVGVLVITPRMVASLTTRSGLRLPVVITPRG